MADNAFYPGYLPDAADGSPSYPGYYPGQKLPYIQKNIKPLKGFDFAMEHLLEEIDALELDLTNQGGYLPGWVKDRLVDDFKQQLKLSVKGSEGFVDVEQLDEYDANSLPGAFGLQVSINPVEWAKDPGKMAKKTFDNIRKAMVNWGDVETRVRENLWRQVIEETPDYTAVVGAENFAGTAPMAEAAANAITRRMRTTAGKYGLTSGIALVSHGAGTRTSKGVESTYELEIDSSGAFVRDPTTGEAQLKILDPATGQYTKKVYTTVEDELAAVGSKVVAFERFSSFAPKRDDKFDEFESAVFSAIDKELGYDPTIKAILADPRNSALKAEFETEFEVFHAKKEIAEGMERMGKVYGGKGGLKSGLQKMILEGRTDGLILYELDSAGNPVVDAATGKFKLAMKKGAPERDLFHSYSDEITTKIADIDVKFFGATPALKSKMDAKDFDALQKRMGEYKKHLEEMKIKVDDARTKIGDLGLYATNEQRAAAIAEIRKMDIVSTGGFIGKGFTGGDMVVESMQRSLLRSMSEELNQRGAKSGLGHLIEELEKKHPNGELKTSITRAYVDRLIYERDSDSIDTVIFMLERGNFMETIIWNRMKRYLTGMTPAYYTEQMLKKLSYFGLVIEDDERFELTSLSGRKLKLSSNLDAPGTIYGNWFSIKHEQEYTYKDLAGLEVKTNVVFNGKIWGGKHFEGMDGLFNMRKLVDSGELTPQALAFMIMHADKDCFENAAFLAKLAELNGGKAVIPKFADKFALQLVSLREWVDKNSARLGGNVNTSDPAYWLGLIDALGKKTGNGAIGLSRRYAGLFDKLVAKLNFIQFVVLKKIGKFLAPINYLKTIVVETISEFFLKLLDAAAGAASGGVLAGFMAALGRVLKPVVRFVVRRVVDATETFVKGIIQGDFFLLFTELEKTFLRFAKYALIVTGIPFFIVFLISMMFGGSTMTTYSPIDPTVPGGISDGNGQPESPFTGDPAPYITTTGVASSVSCFSFVDASGGNAAPWSSNPEKFEIMQDAAAHLQAHSGCYLERLCQAATTIEIYNTTNSGSGFCGWASSTGPNGVPSIKFSDVCNTGGSYTPEYWNYLFAHETAHIYDFKVGKPNIAGIGTFSEVETRENNDIDGINVNWMPTYAGSCSSSNPGLDESFADTVGNFLQVNVWDCSYPRNLGSYDGFWSHYGAHYEYVSALMCAQ